MQDHLLKIYSAHKRVVKSSHTWSALSTRYAGNAYKSRQHRIVIGLPWQSSNPASNETKRHRNNAQDNKKDADANDPGASILLDMSLLLTKLFGTETGHGRHVEGVGLDPTFFCSFENTKYLLLWDRTMIEVTQLGLDKETCSMG